MNEYVRSLATDIEQTKRHLQANQQLNLSSFTAELTHKETRDVKQNLLLSKNRHLDRDESILINKYNHDTDSSLLKHIEVSETDGSINQRRLGFNQPIVIQKARRGYYWLIKQGKFEYVVPHKNLSVNQHNYKIVEGLFELQDFIPELDSQFQLIKPAKVSALSGGETLAEQEKWELVERGVLQFS